MSLPTFENVRLVTEGLLALALFGRILADVVNVRHWREIRNQERRQTVANERIALALETLVHQNEGIQAVREILESTEMRGLLTKKGEPHDR